MMVPYYLVLAWLALWQLTGLLNPATAFVWWVSPGFPDCQYGRMAAFPICDPALSFESRAQDLAARMTFEEQRSWLGNRLPPVRRLGLPGYRWSTEALHGVAANLATLFGGQIPAATMFPMPIALAASFHRELYARVGRVVAVEARAMQLQKRAGATYFTPNVNIVTDPRWGRAAETSGEDLLVTREYLVALAGEWRGPGPYWTLAPTCKHFVAYTLEGAGNASRFSFDAVVGARDLHETYLPTFAVCAAELAVPSIMCSYNLVNGVPSCANPALEQGYLRDALGWRGNIVTDCDAVQTLFEAGAAASMEQAALAALRAGTDNNCGTSFQEFLPASAAAEVEAALRRTLRTLLLAGWFDTHLSAGPPRYTFRDVDTAAHRAAALEAAQESFVLLKNDQNTLPAPSRALFFAAGPAADEARNVMLGDYNGVPPYYVTPRAGLQTRFGLTSMERAGYVVYVGGLDVTFEREGRDRTSLRLPEAQRREIEDLLQAAAAARQRFVAVFFSGGPLDLAFLQADARVGAILWSGYPGQSGGQALADVIAGAASPCARTVTTFYPERYVTRLPATSMTMRPAGAYPGRTYRFYDGPVVYPFGHGLFYSEFQPRLAAVACRTAPNSCDVRVSVLNAGLRRAKYTLLLFAALALPDAPIKQLAAFEWMHLDPGERAARLMSISAAHLSVFRDDGERVEASGDVVLSLFFNTDAAPVYTNTILVPSA